MVSKEGFSAWEKVDILENFTKNQDFEVNYLGIQREYLQPQIYALFDASSPKKAQKRSLTNCVAKGPNMIIYSWHWKTRRLKVLWVNYSKSSRWWEELDSKQIQPMPFKKEETRSDCKKKKHIVDC